MTTNLFALGLIVAVSFFLPLILFLIVWIKTPIQRKGVFAAFITGVCIGLFFEWLIKEQGLKWLYNHTHLQKFVNSHYLCYVFLVALIGAILAVIPEYFVITYGYKRQMSFAKASVLGMGFAMVEAVTLVGYRSFATIVAIAGDADAKLETQTSELFLSSYERVLMFIIHIAIVVILAYFIENKMPVRGCMIALLCMVLESFVPGFLIAFSTTDYLELYTRNTALALVYVVLSVMAFCGMIILNALKYAMKDDKVYSRHAAVAYEEKRNKKHREKGERKAKDIKKADRKGS